MKPCHENASATSRASSIPRRVAAPPGAALIRPPDPGRSQHCLLFAVNVADFTRRDGDDEVQLIIRAALYRLLIAAFETCAIRWDNCHHEDRGDGVLVVIPLCMPTVVAVDPLVGLLRAGVRRHNRLSRDIDQVRLRAAVHIGEVHRDQYGVAGVAVNHLLRLLGAPVVNETLTASRSELALIVSAYVYDSVLRQAGEHVDLDTYRPVDVAVAETSARAWIQAPASCPAHLRAVGE